MCGSVEKPDITSKACLSVFLAKLALDNEGKYNEGFIAKWTYENVPEKVWSIKEMTDFWGIGSRMEKKTEANGNYED